MKTKVCRMCRIEKPVDQFSEWRVNLDWLSDECGDCEEYAIYVLIDPRDSSIRYVGCTTDVHLRLQSHIRDRGYSYSRKEKWIHEVLNCGLSPQLVELEIANYWKHKEREQYWIDYLKANGAPLTNGRNVLPRAVITEDAPDRLSDDPNTPAPPVFAPCPF